MVKAITETIREILNTSLHTFLGHFINNDAMSFFSFQNQYEESKNIVLQGAIGETFYIVVSGQVSPLQYTKT